MCLLAQLAYIWGLGLGFLSFPVWKLEIFWNISSLGVSVCSRGLSGGPNPVTRRIKQHGTSVFNHLPLSSSTQRGRLGALAFFSTPADRFTAATEGTAARRQLRPGPERGPGGGKGASSSMRRQQAATGGRRWMNSTPRDQSGTCSHSRSSFFGSTFVNTTSLLPPLSLTTTTAGTAPFFSHMHRYGKRLAERRRSKDTRDWRWFCETAGERLAACGWRGGWDVWACIDCFHCGIIAIRGCKQASGSVSLLSPMAAMMQHCTFSPPKVLIHCSCRWTVCGLDVLKCSAAALCGWQIMDFFFLPEQTLDLDRFWLWDLEQNTRKQLQKMQSIFSSCCHPFLFLITSHPDNRIGSYSTLSYPILSCPILFHPILSYPILSSPIPSYPIPSHSILCMLYFSSWNMHMRPFGAHAHSCEQKKVFIKMAISRWNLRDTDSGSP